MTGAPAPQPRCPICAKPTLERYQAVLLETLLPTWIWHRWLSGAYAVPGEPDDEAETPVRPEESD